MPYPEASAALLDGVASLAGVAVDSAELHRAGEDTRRRIDELIANNPDHVQLVAQLEAQLDAEVQQQSGFSQLPSGDEIAAELERFLRGQ
jgi:hypothetical protein